MNVLSLFDGMSCGQIALGRAGVKISKYFASEIDKYAISVTQKNYPNTIQIGDITKVKGSDLPPIDLLIGGSPCQGFSQAGKREAFADTRSGLFFEYVRLLNECKPKYFLLENVVMSKENQAVITAALGVEPVFIDSADFTACMRKRLYWTNIEIGKIEPRNLMIGDVLKSEHMVDITDRYLAKKEHTSAFAKSRSSTAGLTSKHRCLTTGGQGIANSGATNIRISGRYYKINSSGAEIMQTVPLGYTVGVSEKQRHRMLGNGWTVDVIAHIFKGLL